MCKLRHNSISKFLLLLVLPYVIFAFGDSFMHAGSDDLMVAAAPTAIVQYASPFGAAFHVSHVQTKSNECAACEWASTSTSSPQAFCGCFAFTSVVSSVVPPVSSYQHIFVTPTSSRAPPAA